MGDRLTRTLLILTFVTGLLDAVAFLALGHVFVAMQTGNVVFLGVALADAGAVALAAPVISLAAFFAGATFAALGIRPRDPRHPGGLLLAVAAEGALLGLAATIALLAEVRLDSALAYLLVGIVAFAMGVRNTVARRVGSPDIATTVLNLTLTALTSHTPFGFASAGELERRGGAILAVLVGAVSGALLLKASLFLALAAAFACVLWAGIGLRGGIASPTK
jgi:uncharacterized membrane protein YoaK (UPF0700 family)